MSLEPLDLFLDVNVYLDAFVSWGADFSPAVLFTGNGGPIEGPPACAIFHALTNRYTVNGKRLVLHSSEIVAALTVSKLITDYKWDEPVADDASALIEQIVRDTGGCFVTDDDLGSLPPIPGLFDREDIHRIAEAQACNATLFITRDTGILNVNDPHRKPFAITPRQFLRMSGVDRRD